MKRSLKGCAIACLVALSGLLVACAPTDLVLKPSYQPTGEVKGSGALVVASNVDGLARPDSAVRIQFVFGEIRNTDGKVKGNVVSKVSPAALVRDALQQELLKSGYAVQAVSELPKDVEHGVVLTAASVSLDEVTSLVKFEAECKVNVTLELWKKGALVRKLTYGKNVADFAVRDREKLHQQLLQRTLGAVMRDAVTDLATYVK